METKMKTIKTEVILHAIYSANLISLHDRILCISSLIKLCNSHQNKKNKGDKISYSLSQKRNKNFAESLKQN